MRRILISSKSEFYYPNGNKSSRNLAVKKLASFFEGVENKAQLKESVTISSSCIHKEKIEESS